jgi:hypothetical protein
MQVKFVYDDIVLFIVASFYDIKNICVWYNIYIVHERWWAEKRVAIIVCKHGKFRSCNLNRKQSNFNMRYRSKILRAVIP